MDFGTLLQTAKKNENQKKEVRYYNTKFSAPRKEERKEKKLSVNIQKFLARKEAEEKVKTKEANQKRDELLSLRSKDKKATRRVNVMLKRTKSANQSVIDDAVDKDNTAVTLAGPSQPDEDDYGYVSQEAAAYYNKMMEKYSTLPEDSKFSSTRKKASSNLTNTKDRVKAALEREKEEALLPHRRKRKHKDLADNKDLDDSHDKSDYAVDREEKQETVRAKPKNAAPPPLNFSELLKLAAQKQHEPIVIEVKPKDDEGPLMTKRQRKEHEKLQQWKEAKERRMNDNNKGTAGKSEQAENRIPKLPSAQLGNHKRKEIPEKQMTKPNNLPKPLEKLPTKIYNNSSSKPGGPATSVNVSKPVNGQKTPYDYHKRSAETNSNQNVIKKNTDSRGMMNNSSKKNVGVDTVPNRKVPLPPSKNIERKIVTTPRGSPGSSISQPLSSSSRPIGKSLANTNNFRKEDKREIAKPKAAIATKSKDLPPKKFPPTDLKPKRFPPDDLKPKQFPPRDLKPKQFPPQDLKPKQFPPPDVRRKELSQRDVKRKPPLGSKRRILDDDDEEYDSEMDDFIDDGPDEMQDYSRYIKDIFGYDKNKYRGMDEDDVDNMESSFAQQMREDIRSTKLGIMEDLEDIQREKDEKKRKALMMKRRKL